ncbi:MAG: efflux RND transporter periplasmic adaptor subunit [Chitinophagales bacterium]|jgi:RND family efflux transporter MFP subunit|nr:efflux RND transporter periplasmic adaptor subunit [Chitinophagales bacterium]
MKFSFYYLILLTFLAFLSCKSKEEKKLSDLLAKKSKIEQEISSLQEDLNALEIEIEKVNPIANLPYVESALIDYQPFKHFIEVQSTINTDKDIIIYPEFQGNLTLLVQEGQKVSQGQVIAKINDGGLVGNLQSVKAQANLAKTAFEKQDRLWKQNIGSEIQYLQAKTQYEAASRQVDAIQTQVGRTNIKAPFSGIVDKVMMQTGQAVAPGVPVMKLVSNSSLKIEAEVSEKYIKTLKPGAEVLISIPTIGYQATSSVKRISTGINPINKTIGIEIPVTPNEFVKSNQTASVKIYDHVNPNAIVVPNEALQKDAQNEYFVYTLSKINNNLAKAIKSKVTVGQSIDNHTEILSGIKPGDIIVTQGAQTIGDGVKVKTSK